MHAKIYSEKSTFSENVRSVEKFSKSFAQILIYIFNSQSCSVFPLFLDFTDMK